jgi:DNA-binding response OmpR family regulator
MNNQTEALNSRILVIDSNVFFARRLTQALKMQGFDVIHSTQASYALTMLEWQAPTAILCATNLREISVFDLPKILHNDAATTNIPILAMGDGGDQSLMEAFRAGCDDYIDRRRGPENIAAQVRTFLLSRQEGFHPTQMLESEQTVLEGSLSHLDLPGVIQMLAQSRQSGVLHINAESLDGTLFFSRGEVLHGEVGETIGNEAVIRIVKNCNGVERGVYKFVPGLLPATRTVFRSVTELMLEALREVDEERAANDGGYL